MSSLAAQLHRFPFLIYLWSWRPHLLEPVLYVGIYGVYLLTRGIVHPQETVALANASRIVALEQALGIFWAAGWQSWTVDNAPGLVVALNWIYILTYWPIILGIALTLYLLRRRTYYYYRNIIVINLALALIIFALFPLAPPFRVPAHFIDTIQTFGPTFYGGSQMAPYYNALAALPSLHFSWSVIFGVMFWNTFKGGARVLGLVYPALTFFAITITGNHYIMDAVAGGATAGVAFAALELGIRVGRRWSRRSRAGTPG